MMCHQNCKEIKTEKARFQVGHGNIGTRQLMTGIDWRKTGFTFLLLYSESYGKLAKAVDFSKMKLREGKTEHVKF